MSVPKLRFPEFRDAGEWKVNLLGKKTIKVGSGITPNGGEKNYKSKGRPFIRSQNIGWGCLLLDDVAFIDDVIHSTFSATEINEGDVFLNITGASIGRSAVADYRVQGGNVNQHVCIIRTEKSELHPYYLNQYLLSQYGQKQIDGFQAGGNRQGLNFAQIRSLLLPFPLIEEQQKIADCLSSLDDRITLETQKLDTLKAHKKGLMQQLFPAEGETLPKLRFPEFQDAREWEEKKLQDICDKIMDGTHFSPKSKSGLCLYLTSKNIQNGIIDLSNVSYISEEEHKQIYKRCPVLTNDLLLTKDGVNTGNCAINNLEFEFSLLSSVAVLRANKSLLNYRFLYQVVLSEKTQKIIKGSISGQAITRITLEKINNFSISMPTLPEQQKIADCLSSIDEAIAAQSQAIELLKLHKKGLMQQLFPSVEEVKG